jgi:RNA polymerase sigma-70 factor (ECF subfamily)
VLGFRASEVADLLDTSEDSVTSALKRARAAMPDERAPRASRADSGSVQVAARFAESFEAGDVDAIIRLLTDDAWLTMPPAPLAYQGHAAIAEFMWVVSFRTGNRRYRLRPTAGANGGQPAFGCYYVNGDETTWRPHGVMVLTMSTTQVSAITRFTDELLPYFGLPETIE